MERNYRYAGRCVQCQMPVLLSEFNRTKGRCYSCGGSDPSPKKKIIGGFLMYDESDMEIRREEEDQRFFNDEFSGVEERLARLIQRMGKDRPFTMEHVQVAISHLRIAHSHAKIPPKCTNSW